MEEKKQRGSAGLVKKKHNSKILRMHGPARGSRGGGRSLRFPFFFLHPFFPPSYFTLFWAHAVLLCQLSRTHTFVSVSLSPLVLQSFLPLSFLSLVLVLVLFLVQCGQPTPASTTTAAATGNPSEAARRRRRARLQTRGASARRGSATVAIDCAVERCACTRAKPRRHRAATLRSRRCCN